LVVAAVVAGAELVPLSASAQAVVYGPPPPPPPSSRVEHLSRFELGFQFGYLFGSEIDTLEGELGLHGNWAYTGNFDFRLPKGFTLVELSYTYFPTEVSLDAIVGPDLDVTDLSVHYFQIGAHQELPLGLARPFIGFTLGGTYFVPETDLYDDEFRFATALLGGVKLVPSETIGVRFQARLPYTWTGTSSSVFCGFGGCSYGYIGDGILQLDLSAGVYVMF
jgi:hypothetical protein